MLAVDQGYVPMAAADLLTKAFKCLSSMIRNLITAEKERNEGQEIQKICMTPAFNRTRKNQTIETADAG